jgi:pimeloyl-ACP methyl ester carboxylesterase
MPLVLLHRFGATADEWQPLVPALSANHHLIVWDMRGHGRSSDPDTSLNFRHEQAARDLLALLDSLKLTRVQAIGGSSGGIILLYAASLAPDRFDAIVPVGLQLYSARTTRDWITRDGPDSADAQVMEASARLHGPEKAMKLARTFWAFRNAYGDPALTPDRLARVTARVLIVHGDDDPIVPVSEAWEAYTGIPKARLWIVPHGRHLPYLAAANRDDFVRRVTEFLDGKWESH